MKKGSITKRKDGRWQGSYQYSVDDTTYRKYVYSLNRMDCTRKLYELINAIEKERRLIQWKVQ